MCLVLNSIYTLFNSLQAGPHEDTCPTAILINGIVRDDVLNNLLLPTVKAGILGLSDTIEDDYLTVKIVFLYRVQYSLDCFIPGTRSADPER